MNCSVCNAIFKGAVCMTYYFSVIGFKKYQSVKCVVVRIICLELTQPANLDLDLEFRPL